jgi:hypothetical protein
MRDKNLDVPSSLFESVRPIILYCDHSNTVFLELRNSYFDLRSSRGFVVDLSIRTATRMKGEHSLSKALRFVNDIVFPVKGLLLWQLGRRC